MTGKLKAIVVDDDPQLPNLLKSILKLKGFETHIARNQTEAIKTLNEHPDAHLLLTDWNLPDGNGGQVVDHLRGKLENKEMHVLGISGATGGRNDPAAMQKYIETHRKNYPDAPEMHFLPKPFGPADVFAKLERMRLPRV